MMEAARLSETSVNYRGTTRLNIPEDRRFRPERRENLKSNPNLAYLVLNSYCYVNQ